MLNNDDLSSSRGEWDSPLDASLNTTNQMANGGNQVCDDGQLFLGAGAEPLSTSRLSVGHQMYDRPSRISKD